MENNIYAIPKHKSSGLVKNIVLIYSVCFGNQEGVSNDFYEPRDATWIDVIVILAIL